MDKESLPIYRLVNGHWVRVPGDVRDPKRRYAGTSHPTTGQSCLREFTDDEERQRDAEEAEWEAQRPQREAEAKRQEDEARRFRESLKYEERVVAFLDVLGWRQAIEESRVSPSLTQSLGIAVKGMSAHVEMNVWQRQHGGPGGWAGDPMITQFSDSLVVSCLSGRYAQHHLESTLYGIVYGLLLKGFVLRGGIAQGLLIHRESLVYGPALVRAYDLENNYSRVPRVVLDEPIAHVWGPGLRVQTGDGRLLGFRKTWRKDNDGWFFFDYLADQFSMPGVEEAETRVGFKWELEQWRELILTRLREHASNPRVLAKFEWLRDYFNTVCAENGLEALAI